MVSITRYAVETYIADGKTISAVEPCETAHEAIERAKAWHKVGMKAIAVKTVIDLAFGTHYRTELIGGNE